MTDRTATSANAPARTPAEPRVDRATMAAWGLFAASMAVFAVLVFGVERDQPLWLDEAWTIAITGQKSWIDFYHQVYWDLNAPLYYLLMHLWQGVFGLSDLALRTPSLIFAALAPLAIAVWRLDGLPKMERLSWAAMTALWFPGLCFAQEARDYSMLLFLSTVQCLAYVQLMRSPTLRGAALWSGLAALSILTHYDAIFCAGLQGLLYLAVHRLRAVRTWPAALAFIPAFGWLAWHMPRIAEFARPDLAWYPLVRSKTIPEILGMLTGWNALLGLLPALGLCALALRLVGARDGVRGGTSSRLPPARDPLTRDPLTRDPLIWAPVAAAVGAAALLVAIGVFRPSFTFRYLTPDAPGVMLGMVMSMAWLAQRGALAALIELVLATGFISVWRIGHGASMAPHAFNYEVASQMLERTHPRRLVFLWDHPVDPIEHPEQLAAAGGAFFHRDGYPVSVDPVVLRPGENPNTRLLAEAASPGSAILWVYDFGVKGTAASAYPPAISTIDPAWRCHRYGQGRFGVDACSRAPAQP